MQEGGRSNLFFEYARIADLVRPRWLLIENVPGLLSSNGGRDFGTVLGTLADIGYGLAWRVLDSRYFGVPQRRRRVFIVGAVADDDPRAAAERAGEVLAVGTRCPGHPATRPEAGPDVAPTLGASVGGGRGWDANPDRTALIAAPLSHGSNPNSNAAGRRREDDENLVTTGFFPTDGRDQRVYREQSPALKVGTGLDIPTSPAIERDGSVRRLTPIECERLQALPDGWTQLGNTPDSKRYAALGDAVTATVAEWIGRRLIAA